MTSISEPMVPRGEKLGHDTIWKYQLELDDEQVVMMPRHSKIIACQVQNDQICLWARVNSKQPTLDRRVIRIVGTGHPCEEVSLEHLGTVQMEGGRLIFHVFENYGT